jgi:DNA-binding beta-propeller fold protein YncE
LAISRDGSRVYVSDTRFNRIEVVDTATNSLIRSAEIKVNGVTSIAVSPDTDGSRLYVATSTATGGVNGSAANKLLVIDAKTGTIIQTVNLQNTSSLSNNVVAVSADGSQVYVSIEKASSLVVIPVASPTVIV